MRGQGPAARLNARLARTGCTSAQTRRPCGAVFLVWPGMC